jgi:GT2 family glycosyltransferase
VDQTASGALATSVPRVSVIIPTYEREKELRDSVAAMLSQPYTDYEVIVVDQTPFHEPETARFLAQVDSQIRYFKLPRPGLLGALNLGAQQATGEVLLFIDDDIVPADDLIGRHMGSFDDPSVGAVVGRVIDDRNLVVEDAPVGRVKVTGEVMASFSATRPAEAETVAGGNVAVRKSVFADIGGFPTGYIGTAVFWEADLGCAVRKRGYRIRFAPDAEVFHLRAPTGGCRNRVEGVRRDYAVYHNALLFAMRYLSPVGVTLAFAVRCNQAIREAWRRKQPWHVALPAIAVVHATFTFARTALFRSGPPSLGVERPSLG